MLMHSAIKNDSACKLLYIEWVNNMVLLYSRGNCIQYFVINHNGKEYIKEYTHMYNLAVQQIETIAKIYFNF